MIAITATPPSVAPTPIPAFAPVDNPPERLLAEPAAVAVEEGIDPVPVAEVLWEEFPSVVLADEL
ncbi:hypothetical protein LTR64_005304 [Lithohypha guttulata]|uniref:uncharacterized protein n=1 Tax=Lithohypha guttulata TaxID=1690604 RepID=UPI002DDE3E76|nr:hypothetical protein LTR51_002901 [Lithohypha guttulata]